MFFERRCAACGDRGPSPCLACVDRLRPETEVEVPGVDRCLVAVGYDDVSRSLVADLKYRGVRSAVGWMTAAMADRLVRAGEHPDLVTWVPAAPANRRRRGFDQGEVLARRLARTLDVPALAVARRRRGRAQTGLSRSQRLAGPAVGPRRGGWVRRVAPGQTIVIVDDVMTTGASLTSVARLLGPATRRVGVVFAHRR